MTDPLPDLDTSARTQRLGVPLTPREHAALHDACAETGKVAAVLVRQLLRTSGYLPPWSVEDDQHRGRPGRQPRPPEPRAHLYAGLLGHYVNLRRNTAEAEQDAGPSHRVVRVGGVCARVRDTTQGVEIMTDYGMAYLIDNDGAGWRLTTISTHAPQEDQ